MGTESFADLFLEASRVRREDGSEREGLYIIGPFADRVSFRSQQYRALNLAWALKLAEKVETGSEVAVVGAGLAGVTVAAALLAMGCRVTVFERGSGIIPRQRDTTHRMVHPSVNWWPAEAMDCTTGLPFLDWHAGDCESIAAQIEGQWNKFFPEDRLVEGVTVESIDHPRAGGVVLNTDPPEKGGDFDLAILAIGFGAERDGEDPLKARDYWKGDDIEADRSMKPRGTFIVSGFGDGGLIDSLRALHRNFRRGRLPIDIAYDLTRTPLASRIAAAERGSARGRVSRLQACYTESAEELAHNPRYVDLAEKLDVSLKAAMSKVVLVDKVFETPYEAVAAPIHKLLIAHAEHRKKVIFKTGVVTKGPDETIRIGQDTYPKGTPVVIRHGATPELRRLLTAVELENLRSSQPRLAKYQATPAWTGSYPVPAGVQPDTPNHSDFWHDRFPLAKSAAAFLDDQSRLAPRAGGYDLIHREGLPPARIPKSLFRVRVTARPVATTDTLL